MAELFWLQTLRDLNHIQQTEHLRNINNALGDLANQAQVEAIEKAQEKHRLESLPKCPECHKPIESAMPPRCSTCTGSLVWITPYTAISATHFTRGYDCSPDLANDVLVNSLDTHITTIHAAGDVRINEAIQRGFESVSDAARFCQAFLVAAAQHRHELLLEGGKIKQKLKPWSIWLPFFGVMLLLCLELVASNSLNDWQVYDNYPVIKFIAMSVVVVSMIGGLLVMAFVAGIGQDWLSSTRFGERVLSRVSPRYRTLLEPLSTLERFGAFVPLAIDATSRGMVAENKSDCKPGWVPEQEADDYVAASRLLDVVKVWSQAISLWLTPVTVRIEHLKRNGFANEATPPNDLVNLLKRVEAELATPMDWLAVCSGIGLPERIVEQGRRLLSWAVPDAPLRDAMEAKYAAAKARLTGKASQPMMARDALRHHRISDQAAVFCFLADLLAVPAVVSGKLSPEMLAAGQRELAALGRSEKDARDDFIAACKRVFRETPEQAVKRLIVELDRQHSTGECGIDAASTWKGLVAIASLSSGDKERIKKLLHPLKTKLLVTGS